MAQSPKVAPSPPTVLETSVRAGARLENIQKAIKAFTSQNAKLLGNSKFREQMTEIAKTELGNDYNNSLTNTEIAAKLRAKLPKREKQ